ncbi:MAG: hypothetical protein GY856_25650 [bacterium]|nr:hypothetical protein [bacterium]
MPESSQNALVAQIEALIENGEFAEARRTIEQAESRRGRQLAFDELRHRLDEVETIANRSQLDAIVRRAREDVSRANYPAAMETLKRAIMLAPRDPDLRQLLEETTKAALRHDSAVERNRAVAQVAERIEALIDRGEREAARTEIEEAGITFGRHNTLLMLQERLSELDQEAELERTMAYVIHVRSLIDGKNWRGALQEAERILKLDPKNEEAIELKWRARTELDREEGKRHHAQEVDKARQDVERLITADALPLASRRLQEAIDRLGQDAVFTELAKRIDQAKAALQVSKRLEWTERRTRESEDLVRHAGRLSLQGRYDEAIERLQAARELDPNHSEIEGMLKAATTAWERQLAERRRSETLAARRAEIRGLLDALDLKRAEALLRQAQAEFGGDDFSAHFAALRTRLSALREAQTLTPTSTPPVSGAQPDHTAEAAALRRQRAFSSAYSWKQILLFPFRSAGLIAFWGLLTIFLALEILDNLPAVERVFGILRFLVPLGALGLLLGIVRATLEGKTDLPPWNKLFDLRRWALDFLLWAAVAAVAGLPLVLFVVTSGWHALLSTDGGPLGWLIAALLGWLAAAVVVLACGAAGAFGNRQIPRFVRHARALRAGEPETLLAINIVFGVVVAIVVLRATFVLFIPWIGSPLAAGLEAWGLLAVPHMIGVVVRRHHLELTRLYS